MYYSVHYETRLPLEYYMTWIFGSFLVTPWALTSCHVVIRKQGWQCIGKVRSSNCITGRRPRDVRTTRSDLDRVQRITSRARDRQPIRLISDVSDDTAWKKGCKRWHSLVPRRRYGTRRSPPSEYMTLHLSFKLTANCGILSGIKWEIYFYKEVFRSFIEFRKSCRRLYNKNIYLGFSLRVWSAMLYSKNFSSS